jgi:hypothetical protein
VAKIQNPQHDNNNQLIVEFRGCTFVDKTYDGVVLSFANIMLSHTLTDAIRACVRDLEPDWTNLDAEQIVATAVEVATMKLLRERMVK